MINVNESDAKFARDAWIRALGRTAPIGKAGICLPSLMDELAERFGEAPALSSREERMNYREFGGRCRRYARWGLERGLARGDVAALLMTNCAEYLAVWLGLTRIGVVVALVNHNLSGEPLAHSIGIVRPKVVIVGADLAHRLVEIRARLAPDIACRVLVSSPVGSSPVDLPPIALELDAVTQEPWSGSSPAAPSLEDTALYIYTSGTTGLPKAARVSHHRLMQWSHWFAGMLDTRPHDRMFNCLPLYHSVGGVVATFATLVSGGAVVIRPRFSAAEFWRDLREERCTLFQYIGELCRYLVNTPPAAGETEHSLRLACGNGLRPEVWEPFKSRFRIPRILEYYASTEGNFSLYNCEGRPGAIGRIPAFLKNRLPVELLRFDLDAAQPRRTADGLCERCDVGEIGEAVGFIPAVAGLHAGRFEGYADAEASARKVLRDVFVRGDQWYRTGDLMRRDAAGFYYFVDRVGDTYRWKGENVSTAEVLSVVCASPGVCEAVVYGVAVPGTDGRAGAAALVVAPTFDLAAFRRDMARLPAYARPVFVRILTALAATGTFKPLKQELLTAGVDPLRVADRLYFDDPRSQRYETLDSAAYAAICEGRIRI
jgi:fatty-acyl-CoA synthase